jgi:hypothetical protein
LRASPSALGDVLYPHTVLAFPYGIDVNPKDGRVCSSQSNLPGCAIEGAVPSYLCIDPAGAERDRALLAAAQRAASGSAMVRAR